ncbi:MAG: hypothetical protein JWP73_1650 [Phenylobacterium sp.]|nr:hypothetical protein [Phenylobacterium sp.]
MTAIGEPRGGVTGTAGLHRYLETRLELLRTLVIPQFPRTRDAFHLYRRVR